MLLSGKAPRADNFPSDINAARKPLLLPAEHAAEMFVQVNCASLRANIARVARRYTQRRRHGSVEVEAGGKWKSIEQLNYCSHNACMHGQ